MLDGRVKTLHPAVHGGILAKRGDAAHMAAIKTHAIGASLILAHTRAPRPHSYASLRV
jgi:AICAR transformylase/IMP cyclohydrolase PurH